MGRFSSFVGVALVATAAFSSFASAVEYVSVQGANFVSNSTGKRFSIIGVDYQPGGSSGFSGTADPLSDATACLRDAILMQRIGVNTIRVYNLSPEANHDDCVSIFNAAGIYMIIDVNSGLAGQFIDRSSPANTYTSDYLQHIFKMVEAFAGYPNLLGFFAANEIINEQSSADAPKYIRAVVRDLKDYIAAHAPRPVGVGYSAADVADLLESTWNYLGCGLASSPTSKIDFFGLNDYEWCGDSSFQKSGYDKLTALFANTNLPVFFSEYGCNLVTPRTFTNVPSLYGPDMSVLSGGLVYEYSQEPSNYGLVAINNSKSVTLLPDYSYLAQQYASLNMDQLTTLNKTAVGQPVQACDAKLIKGANFTTKWDLPPRPSGGDDLIKNGVSGAKQGKLTDVKTLDMPATVTNGTQQVAGLKLVQLGCADSNYPGLTANYKASAQTCQYATTPPTSGSNSGGSGNGTKNAAGALAPPGRVAGGLAAVGSLLGAALFL